MSAGSDSDSLKVKETAKDATAGGAATATAYTTMEFPSVLAVSRQIAPVWSGFSTGQRCLQGTENSASVCGTLAGAKADAPSAHTIHSPFRDSGITSANVASLRNMTVLRLPTLGALVNRFLLSVLLNSLLRKKRLQLL